jgi:hypothetical protein
VSDENQNPEGAQPPANQPAPAAQQVIPVLLTAQEINTIVVTLRKFPMEQIEGLVGNIRMQFNNFVTNTTPKE